MIATIKGAVSLCAVFFAGGSLTTMLAESNITEASNIQLGLVGGLILGVFYAGTVLQKLKDGQKSTNARLARIERKLHISEHSDKEDDD